LLEQHPAAPKSDTDQLSIVPFLVFMARFGSKVPANRIAQNQNSIAGKLPHAGRAGEPISNTVRIPSPI
jgi:hypothetical protein